MTAARVMVGAGVVDSPFRHGAVRLHVWPVATTGAHAGRSDGAVRGQSTLAAKAHAKASLHKLGLRRSLCCVQRVLAARLARTRT